MCVFVAAGGETAPRDYPQTLYYSHTTRSTAFPYPQGHLSGYMISQSSQSESSATYLHFPWNEWIFPWIKWNEFIFLRPKVKTCIGNRKCAYVPSTWHLLSIWKTFRFRYQIIFNRIWKWSVYILHLPFTIKRHYWVQSWIEIVTFQK